MVILEVLSDSKTSFEEEKLGMLPCRIEESEPNCFISVDGIIFITRQYEDSFLLSENFIDTGNGIITFIGQHKSIAQSGVLASLTPLH
jgi:hypothetical protein